MPYFLSVLAVTPSSYYSLLDSMLTVSLAGEEENKTGIEYLHLLSAGVTVFSIKQQTYPFLLLSFFQNRSLQVLTGTTDTS